MHFPKHKRSGLKLLGQKKWYAPSKSLFSKFNYRVWIWPIFSGLLMSLSLPSAYNQLAFARSFLAWFALIPLFCILWNSKNYFEAFAKCFLAGLSLNLICFRFLLGIHPLDWMGVPENLSLAVTVLGLFVAAFQQAIYWGIYGLLFKLVHKTLGLTQWSVFKLSLIWVIWQEKMANSAFGGGIPWTSLYYSQTPNLALMQIADILGGSGISFLIIFANLALAQFIFNSNKKDFLINLSAGLQFGFLLFIYLVYGFIILFNSAPERQGLKALLLQKNLSISETRYNNQGQQVQAFVKLSQKVGKKTDLILIPEGSFKQNQISQLKIKSNLIFGAYFKDAEKNSFNVAIAITRQNKTYIYRKQVLVPFGEYIPFQNIFQNVLKNFRLDYLVETSFKTGKEPQVFQMPFGNIAPLICFEALFPEINNKQIQAGGEAIAILGDSSWFDNYQGLVASQMLATAQARAIESRRNVLVDINKGPLASIDKYGRIQAYSKNAEFLETNFNLNSKQSFFTRIQW